MNYFIGVDVGTGSVRAGIFDSNGKQYGIEKKNTTTWSYDEVFKEQSSDEIWENICFVIKRVIENSKIDKNKIKGIGFDATCSLVALDENFNPVTVSKTKNQNQNIILWMDHRASEETKFINNTKHEVLKFVGGKVSVEMELPKVLWIKNNMFENYSKTKYFFDLPDFLVFKATGKIVRSMCSLGCKWNYLNHKNEWDDSFISKIGLDDIVKSNYETIGGKIQEIGEVAGNLSEETATVLGLNSDIKVGVSMIDAHAGGVGIIGIDDDEEIDYNSRIALIGGTSSCHMAVSSKMTEVNGVWGPYYGAMLPNMWLLEGGQSATGVLVDYVIHTHPAYEELIKVSNEKNISIYEELNECLDKLSKNSKLDLLTKNVHVLPYFIGNRSPRANSDLRGMISGLTMDKSIENLAVLYLATIQAIACGTRHIIEVLNERGFSINKIFMTGGGTKNPIFLKTHSNVTGCDVILGKEEESVLLGASILGAVASGEYEDIETAMKNMSKFGKKISYDNSLNEYYDKKYKVFKKMYEDYLTYNEIMK